MIENGQVITVLVNGERVKGRYFAVQGLDAIVVPVIGTWLIDPDTIEDDE